MSGLHALAIIGGSLVVAALLTWGVWAVMEWMCPDEERKLAKRRAKMTPEEIERDVQLWRELEARYRCVDMLKHPRRVAHHRSQQHFGPKPIGTRAKG